MERSKMEKVLEVSKRRGIVYPAAEIYGSLSGFWDYGPVGTLIKRKIENYWREFFIKGKNIVEISGSTVLPEAVFKASGHIDSFVDPITQCKKCKSIHRADHLIDSASKTFVEGKDVKELTDIIKKEKIKCPKCKGELGDVKIFNLMLKTEVSASGGQTAYLRPETAQNIFTSFRRVFLSARGKLPFGIAQIGHSFRNEISPRHFIIRVREFSQFEIEMFIDPDDIDNCPGFDSVAKVKLNFLTRDAQKKGGKAVAVTAENALKKKLVPNKWLAYFMAKQMQFYQNLGIPAKVLRHRSMLPEETPHYSKGNFDLEIEFDFGWKETVGNSYRTDYDLKKHSDHSKTDLSVTIGSRKVVPHVVEPSFGLERTFASILLHCFREDKKRGWNWLALPPRIAPYTIAIMPLVKKDKLPEKAREIYNELLQNYGVFYDESGSIGKRYARADEIGVPYCITVDHQTLDDNTVTIRDRDSTKQIRLSVKDICSVIYGLVNGKKKFDKLGEPVK
jgi:glycyl-tRNA synthetase